MRRLTAILGNSAAVLGLVTAVLVPFLLIDLFTRGVAATGIRIDPASTGGSVVRTLDKDGYRIAIHELVPRRTPFERRDPFVQIKWEPAAKLPPRIADEIDLDGDGQADARVTFDVPSDAAAPLRAKIEGLTTRVRSVEEVRQQSFSCLIARVNDAILVRVPLR